jgi:ribonucleoside-diphosphate reductase alpha chain
MPQLLVKKRDGNSQKFDKKKILDSALRACNGLPDVSAEEIVADAEIQLFAGVSTTDIDKTLILSARAKIEKEPSYAYAAARLLLNILYKEVFGIGTEKAGFASQYQTAFIENIKTLVSAKRLDERLLSFDLEKLSEAIMPGRDLLFKYFGLQTLYDRYFIHLNGRRLETPQAFFMRVAMGLALNEPDKEQATLAFYDRMSQFLYMPSTPTLFNSGTCHPQLCSCFVSTQDDSIDGIFGTIHNQARLSKYAGGISVDYTPLRGTNAYIQGTNGQSQGLIPWIKVLNDTMVAVNQGSKRKGKAVAYLEPWHVDIEDFLDLLKNTGDDRRRAHDIHTALWIPDAFMEAVEKDEVWYLFSPEEVKDLHELYGEAFTKKYKEYCEAAEAGKVVVWRKLKARDLFKKILKSLYETGHPWMCFKDQVNKCYTNKHCGTIYNSNLCVEYLGHTKPTIYKRSVKIKVGETSVCDLASVNLAAHCDKDGIDYPKLSDTIKYAIRGLDNGIDINYYPIEEAENSMKKHRPVGLGCMGFADVLHKLELSYDSEAAVKLSNQIQEFIAYNATVTSVELAAERGKYPTYEGSDWSKGILPIDYYEVNKNDIFCDWDYLRKMVAEHGMRNDNVQAIAPTATISYIVGCSQSIEPDYAVLYSCTTLSGDFTMINEYFVKRAKEMGIWGPELIAAIKRNDGDLNKMSLPASLKEEFKTAFDIDYHKLIDCAAARQRWIDMGQSLNLYNKSNSLKSLYDMYMYAWQKKLKTTYYLRGKAASAVEKSTATPSCSIEAAKRGEVCESCQ